MAGPWEAYAQAAPAPQESGPWSNYLSLEDFAAQEAQAQGLDPELVRRVGVQESGWKADAVSPAGARGPMQLMPSTAAELGVNPDDPYDNIRGGVRYLKQQMDQFGSPDLALAAYNAGPGAVQKHGGIPPYAETQNYVGSILNGYAPSAAATAPTLTPGADRGVYDPTTGQAWNDAQATTLRGIQNEIDTSGEVPTYKGFPIFASKDGAAPDQPGAWYVTLQGELKQNPVTVDEGLGFLKGVFKPLDNAATWVEGGLERAGMDTEAAARFFGTPTAAAAEQGRADYIAEQARQGVVPGKLGEFGGNVVGTLPTAMLPGGVLAQGAAGGALLSEADTLGGVARDATIGAVGGKLGDLALRGVAGSLRGVTDEGLQLLRREGVPLTLGQMSNNRFIRGAEDKLTSVPGLGDVIKGGQRRSVEGLNRAPLQRALDDVGERLPDGIVGYEAVEHTGKVLGDKYEELLPNLTIQADQPFVQNVGNLWNLALNLESSKRDLFENIIKNEVIGRFSQGGGMTGETMKRVESDLSRHIRGIRKSPGSTKWDHDLADALEEAQDQLRQLVVRNNPARGPELQAINRAWSKYKVAEKAAGSGGAVDGIATPAMLDEASRAGASASQRGTGKGVMSDLTKAGRKHLPQTVPNSGSTDRALLALMAGGAAGHFVPPAMPLVIGAGALASAYTPIGRQMAELALMARPQAARVLADQFPKLKAPVVAGGSAALVGSRQ